MRKCNNCDAEMHQGYVFDGSDYYCTDECLSTVASPKQWQKLHNEEADYFYWTTFDDDGDVCPDLDEDGDIDYGRDPRGDYLESDFS